MSELDKWISPIQQMRVPNGLLDRMTANETAIAQQSSQNTTAEQIADMTLDPWSLNASFPSICQGRLTGSSGDPAPNFATSQNVYFTPYIGNLIGMYNGSTWDQIPFAELTLPTRNITISNITVTNGSAVLAGLDDTSQLVVGMWVGTGSISTGTPAIPANTTILSIDSPTQITMSANATGTGTCKIQFDVPWQTALDVFMVNTGNGVLALRMILWSQIATASVTAATNASPIVITTGLAASLTASVGQVIQVRGVSPAGVNGFWRVGAIAGSNVTLLNPDGTNSAAAGAFVSGGTAGYISGQTTTTRSSALAFQDGTYVLSSDHTWRYLGTVNAQGGITRDNLTSRWIWNYYNRLPRSMLVADATATWTSSAVATWVPDRNNLNNRLDLIVGISELTIPFKKIVSLTCNAQNGRSGVNIDTATGAPSVFGIGGNTAATNVTSTVSTEYFMNSGAGLQGYHFLQGMEFASNTAGAVWNGAGAHAIIAQFFG